MVVDEALPHLMQLLWLIMLVDLPSWRSPCGWSGWLTASHDATLVVGDADGFASLDASLVDDQADGFASLDKALVAGQADGRASYGAALVAGHVMAFPT